MHERDIAKLKAIRSSDPVAWLNYKQCRNSVNNAIGQAKKSYYTKALHDNRDFKQITTATSTTAAGSKKAQKRRSAHASK